MSFTLSPIGWVIGIIIALVILFSIGIIVYSHFFINVTNNYKHGFPSRHDKEGTSGRKRSSLIKRSSVIKNRR